MSLLHTHVNIDRTFLFKKLVSLHKRIDSPLHSDQKGGTFISSYYDSHVTITSWLYCEITTTEFLVRRHKAPSKQHHFYLITKWHIRTSEWCEYDSFWRSYDGNMDGVSYMCIMLLSGHSKFCPDLKKPGIFLIFCMIIWYLCRL